MSGASIETTLGLWAASLRDIKARMRPLLTQTQVAASPVLRSSAAAIAACRIARPARTIAPASSDAATTSANKRRYPASGATGWLGLVAVLTLIRAEPRGLACCGAVLQRLDAAAQRAGGGDAENEVEPLGAAEIQHFGRAVMALGAEQDVHTRPVAPDGADRAAQKDAHLAPVGPAGWAQQSGDEACPTFAPPYWRGMRPPLIIPLGMLSRCAMLLLGGYEPSINNIT